MSGTRRSRATTTVRKIKNGEPRIVWSRPFSGAGAATAAYAGDPKGMAQMFANVNFYTSIASFTASSLLVGLTLRKIGTGGSLMTAGFVNLAMFALFPFMPTLGVAALFFGLDGVTRYTWFKTAKESTYAATDRDTIYRVKAFVEMFVYRFARGLAGLLLLGVAWLKGGPSGAAMLGIRLPPVPILRKVRPTSRLLAVNEAMLV